MLARRSPPGRHPGERLASSRWPQGGPQRWGRRHHVHCPGTGDPPRWSRNTTTAHPAWRLPLPARTCSRPRPKHGHAHL